MVRSRPFLTAASVAALACAGLAVAQIDGGDRGVAPIDSSGDFEVTGIGVDVVAKSAEVARVNGWQLAQRKAWAQLTRRLGVGTPGLSDGTLDQLVSAVVVEDEQIGPTRYIARLGVLFDRGRVGSLLGIATYSARSVPMLVIPVQYAGGVGQVFETRTDWQQAWARFRTGASTIDYVRPTGSGSDPLLLNVGQIGRRSRSWWRTVIDQYGASNILVPVVHLYRTYPGGPVVGAFEARWGPDNQYLGGFSLRVGSAEGLPQLLDKGVERIDALFEQALRSGELRQDASLLPFPEPEPTPSDDPVEEPGVAEQVIENTPAGPGISVVVQFDTPGAGAVSAAEASVRGVAGVRSASTTSLALGGVSLMRVVFDGDPAALASGLQARGWQVFGSGQTLRIRRVPQLLPPDLPPDRPADGTPAG